MPTRGSWHSSRDRPGGVPPSSQCRSSSRRRSANAFGNSVLPPCTVGREWTQSSVSVSQPKEYPFSRCDPTIAVYAHQRECSRAKTCVDGAAWCRAQDSFMDCPEPSWIPSRRHHRYSHLPCRRCRWILRPEVDPSSRLLFARARLSGLCEGSPSSRAAA